MLLVGFVGFSIIVDNAYGLVIPLSPEELLEQSQAIFVGNITSVNVLEFEKSSTYYTEEDGMDKPVIENYTLSLDEYTVSVEEFVKNPQNSTTLTVRQPTTSIPGRVVPIGGFELGDRVLFYIQNLDDVNEYSFESFKIPKKCDANSVLLQSRLVGTDYSMLQNEIKKQDNFTANLPITFVFESDTRTLYGQSFDVEIFVSKQEDKTFSNRVFHEKISVGSEICKWIGIVKSEFTLDSGKYLLNGNISDDDSRFSFSNQFSVVMQSPLKQTKLGKETWSITCKEGLSVLSQKKHFFYNSRSACVTPETKTKLIERGWNLATPTSELTYFDKSQEFEIGQKFEDFMKKQSYNNVPNAFVIGKHNFKNNGDIAYFCGEFKEISVNYSHYFHGAIDGSGTLVWDGIQKQSAWCAINDDAHQFNFTYDWKIENEN